MDYPHSVPGVSLLDGRFTDGNPLLGVPASRDPASWANAVTDEILSVLAAAGIAPDEGDNTQLVQALAALIAEAIPAAPANASDTVKGIVELATSAEVIAGTDSVRAVTAAALAALTATEARRGLVELASSAETQTGTDSAMAVTPAGLESARPGKARCTAWVNLNGTGLFTVNYSTEMSAANYSVVATASKASNDAQNYGANPIDTAVLTGSVQIRCSTGAAFNFDPVYLSVNVFGGK